MRVLLFGGLGNQLFQLAAARALSNTKTIEAEYGMLPINTDSTGMPDVNKFNFGNLAEISFKRVPKTKFEAFCLKETLILSSTDKLSAKYFHLLKSIVQLTLKFLIGSVPQFPRGVGFDSSLPQTLFEKPSAILVGNFHSHQWGSLSKKTTSFKKFVLTAPMSLTNEYAKLAKEERPIAVHLRLGDYTSLDELNILTHDYYERAFELMSQLNTKGRYWIFTNDESGMSALLQNDVIAQCRVVSQELDAANTLEVMRHCYSYIIANSTFSWWGAYSSHNQNAPVITPKNWFRTKASPNQIIPPHWHIIDNFTGKK
jgi:hypothetical protein